jgi:hypothetical protein
MFHLCKLQFKICFFDTYKILPIHFVPVHLIQRLCLFPFILHANFNKIFSMLSNFLLFVLWKVNQSRPAAVVVNQSRPAAVILHANFNKIFSLLSNFLLFVMWKVNQSRPVAVVGDNRFQGLALSLINSVQLRHNGHRPTTGRILAPQPINLLMNI